MLLQKFLSQKKALQKISQDTNSFFLCAYNYLGRLKMHAVTRVAIMMLCVLVVQGSIEVRAYVYAMLLPWSVQEVVHDACPTALSSCAAVT